ncbi:hypothetical protein BDZ97DRAFT_1906199 [Flammula alnicola]|nr:hypothetical protein BDZ97DRAFT_1906199 [Flammula alnicola]
MILTAQVSMLLYNHQFIFVTYMRAYTINIVAIDRTHHGIHPRADIVDLEAQLTAETARCNELRLSGAPLDESRKTLPELKKALALVAWRARRGRTRRRRKTCFTTFGGACLDTPVFERKDVLTDKYGEDAKLIFDLMDQGGEQLALRYDHTVPLARYLAMNDDTVTQSKLWQIGKGRMREFMQAVFDISGTWDPMIPDTELLSLLSTILSRLDVGEFTIKLNHRKILDGIFEVCSVPSAKIHSISSAVDKMDKLPWSEVKKEMMEEKGLDGAIADEIGEYVKHKGGPELLAQLEADATLTANKSTKQGLSDMTILFTLLEAYTFIDKISFDLSLARGLDYYTGIIYEAIVEASAPPTEPTKRKSTTPDNDEKEIDESQVAVGSIAAGGRYDGLVGAFLAGAAGADPASKEGRKAMGPRGGVPCVGVSIGRDSRGGWTKETMVFVLSAGDGLLKERVGLVSELRAVGIKVRLVTGE